MKSKQLDRIAETSCKDCKFAIYEGKTQTGCEAGRAEIYMEKGMAFEAYDKDKEFFQWTPNIFWIAINHLVF